MEKEIYDFLNNKTLVLIISLHMPKTAGLSFKTVLQEHFGKQLIEEYVDLPLIQSKEDRMKSALKSRLLFNLYRRYNFERKGFKCIHGHFLPYKFTGPAATGIRYITWLRDPIDRMCSHYYYWLRSYKVGKSPILQAKIVEENWSLEDFCFSEEMRNVYDQYLWRFPIEKFSFIGITEYFEEDLRYFAKKNFNLTDFKIPIKNINNERRGQKYDLEPDLIDKIRDFHSRDYEIYQYALEERKKRII